MRRHDVLQTCRIKTRQKTCRLIIVQMSETPAHPLLELVRIGARAQHPGIMVAFQHQRVTAVEHGFDVWCDVPGIGQHPQSARAVTEHVLHRFGRIVRHRARLDLDVADSEALVRVDFVHGYAGE